MPDLSVNIAGKRLLAPVLPASGTFEPLKLPFPSSRFKELGALVNKTITLRPRPGNPPPRVWETTAGLLNAVGIPSEGVEAFVKEILPQLREKTDCLIVSIAAFSLEDFCALAERIACTGLADMLELNLSCPNIERHTSWSSDQALLAEVVRAVKAEIKLPLLVKLSPNVTDLATLAQVAEESGADGLSLVNTFKGLAIDLRAKRPALGNITGGLSGPAIKPLALYAVWEAYKRVRIPIIGMGGICCWQDALEFILAGATAVAVGMYNFVDPEIMWKIIAGLKNYLSENKYDAISKLIGLAHRNLS